jgi:hypothetical protein
MIDDVVLWLPLDSARGDSGGTTLHTPGREDNACSYVAGTARMSIVSTVKSPAGVSSK